MNKDLIHKQLLQEELHLLNQSLESLRLSVNKCSAFLGKSEYSFEEMESFDSLTSKFARTSDIYTQKVLRTCFALLHEPFVPFLDLANQSEKMSLIISSDDLIMIRDLRNQVTHEYKADVLTSIVPEVIAMHSILANNIRQTIQFIEHRGWNLAAAPQL